MKAKETIKLTAFWVLILIFVAGCGSKEKDSPKSPPQADRGSALPELEQNQIDQPNAAEPPDYSFEDAPDSFELVNQAEADLLNPPAD